MRRLRVWWGRLWQRARVRDARPISHANDIRRFFPRYARGYYLRLYPGIRGRRAINRALGGYDAWLWRDYDVTLLGALRDSASCS